MPIITYTEFTNIIKQDEYKDRYVSLNEDGTLYTWAYGDPTPTVFATDVNDFQSNGRNIIVFKNDDTIWVEGNNEHGVLYTGDLLSIPELQQFIPPAISHITKYELDDFNLFIYDKDDNVWGIGYNNPIAKLWMDKSEESVLEFTKIGRYASISCGEKHIIAQTPDGRIMAKGSNENGALGLHKGPTYTATNFEYTGMITASSSKPTAKYSIDFPDIKSIDQIEMQYGSSVTPSLSTTQSSVLNEDFIDITNWDITNANGLYTSDGNALVINNSNIADSNYYIQTNNLYKLPFRLRTSFEIIQGIENSKFILEFLDNTDTLIDSVDLTLDKNDMGDTSRIFNKYNYGVIPAGIISLEAHISSYKQFFFIYNENGVELFKTSTERLITSNIKLRLKIVAADNSKVFYMIMDKLFSKQENRNLRFNQDFLYKVQKDADNNIKTDWKRLNLNDVNFKVLNSDTMVEVDFDVDKKKEAIKIKELSTTQYYYLKLSAPQNKPHTDIPENVTTVIPETVAVTEEMLMYPYGGNTYKISGYMESSNYERPIILEYDSVEKELKIRQWRFPGKLVDLKNLTNIGANDKIIIGNKETTIEQYWLEYAKVNSYVKLPIRNEEYVPLTVKRISMDKSEDSQIFIDFD